MFVLQTFKHTYDTGERNVIRKKKLGRMINAWNYEGFNEIRYSFYKTHKLLDMY